MRKTREGNSRDMPHLLSSPFRFFTQLYYYLELNSPIHQYMPALLYSTLLVTLRMDLCA